MSNSKTSQPESRRPPPRPVGAPRGAQQAPRRWGPHPPSRPVSTSGNPRETTGSPGMSLCSRVELPLVPRTGQGSAAVSPAGVRPPPPAQHRRTSTQKRGGFQPRTDAETGQVRKPGQGRDSLTGASASRQEQQEEVREGGQGSRVRRALPRRQQAAEKAARGALQGRGQERGQHQEPWACLWPRGSRSVRSYVWLEGLNVAI